MIASFVNSQEYINTTQAAIDTYLANVLLSGYILV